MAWELYNKQSALNEGDNKEANLTQESDNNDNLDEKWDAFYDLKDTQTGVSYIGSYKYDSFPVVAICATKFGCSFAVYWCFYAVYHANKAVQLPFGVRI
jgi:hypothetical protein